MDIPHNFDESNLPINLINIRISSTKIKYFEIVYEIKI